MATSSAVAVPELAPDDLVYVERVRQATKRLAYRAPAPDDLEDALQALEDVSHFDVEVPTASNRREVEVLKSGVKRLLAWYMRYLAVELNNFSAATARLAEVLARRTEKLEKGSDELAARVGALEERVRRLESGARRSAPAKKASTGQ
jgi:cell division protein FtsB